MHNDDMEITITTGFWFWKKTRTFSGDSTVWRDVETGKRAGLILEGRLCDIWWKRKYDERKGKS